MPTGSKDPEILLSWLLDSMGLVRRKSESGTLDEAQGAIHRLMMGALLPEPLAGWDAKSLGEASGLSQTGVHHQLVKLRESGLVSAQSDGRWHVHVLRGGSISAAVEILSAECKAILGLRMSELGQFVRESDERMVFDGYEGGVCKFCDRCEVRNHPLGRGSWQGWGGV